MLSKQTLFANRLTIYPFRQYDLLVFAKQLGNNWLEESGECHALVLAFLGQDNIRVELKKNSLKTILPIVRQLSSQLNGNAYREYGSESPEYNTYGMQGREPRQFYCPVDLNHLIDLFKMLEFNQGVVLKIGAEKLVSPTPQSPYPRHMLGIKKTDNGIFELFDPNKGIYEGRINCIASKLLDILTQYTADSKIIGYTITPFNKDNSMTNKFVSKL